MARKASRRQDEQIIASMMTSTDSKASRTGQGAFELLVQNMVLQLDYSFIRIGVAAN